MTQQTQITTEQQQHIIETRKGLLDILVAQFGFEEVNSWANDPAKKQMINELAMLPTLMADMRKEQAA